MPRTARNRNVLPVFGEGLRRARVRARLTQEEAAYKMKSDRVSWVVIEKGRRNISLAAASAAADAVGSSVPAILAEMILEAGDPALRRALRRVLAGRLAQAPKKRVWKGRRR